ncbi:MAG: potassium channel family protein [bacterium]
MLTLLKKETRKLRKAFFHPTFVYLTLVGTGILLASTTLLHYLEKDINPKMKTYFDSLWWGVSTITTVGYGDVTPVTTMGRIIGLALMYTGTVLFITFAGILVSVWMQEEVVKEITPLEREVRKEEREQTRIERKLDEILKRLDHLEKR